MKRLIVFACLVLSFVSFTVKSEAFIHSRYGWWKQRKQQLEEKKSFLQKNNGTDTEVLALVDGDILRARQILSVFEGALKNDGSLDGEMFQKDPATIQRLVRLSVPPVFSVYYLAALAGHLGDWKNIDSTKDAVRNYLEEKIKKRFGREEKELTDLIITEDIDYNEWKSISAELFFGKMMLGREDVLASVTKDVEQNTEKELSSGKNIETTKSLMTEIMINAVTRLKEGIIPGPRYDVKALEMSWTWSKIFVKINRDFCHYETIISFLGKNRKIPLERIRFFFRNPSSLESEIFGKKNHSHYLYEKSFSDGKKYTAGKGQVVLVIPEEMNCKAILDEMDEFRKKAIRSVDGKETRDFYIQLSNKGNQIVSARTGRARKIFKNEEKRLEKIRGKKGEEPIEIVNLNEFEDARKAYNVKSALAYRYKRKSIEFVSWLSETMKIHERDIVNGYQNQLVSMNHYLEFTIDLVRDCLDASATGNGTVHDVFIRSALRLDDVFQYLHYSLSLRDREKSVLSNKSHEKLMEQKGTFMLRIKGARKTAAEYRGEYTRLKAHKTGMNTAASERLRNRIAQEEVFLLVNSTKGYADLLAKRDFTDSIFNQYALKYNELENQAAAGIITPELSKVFDQYSVFQSLAEYDEKKIGSEVAERKMLREEIRTGIARISALLDFYKRRGVYIEDRPGYDEIEALHKITEKNYQIRVAEWTMTETNYGTVDKNVAEKLKHIVNRQIWISSETAKDPIKSGKIIMLKMPEWDISFSLPYGWSEARGNENDVVLKSYRSMDRQTDVNFARLVASDKNHRDISENWITDSKSVKIKERWGKIRGVEYFWMLSRDRDRSVRETFSFSKNGSILIISGRARKDLYPYFRKKLQEIIESISF